MTEPWGISGEQFILLYLGFGIGAIVVGFLLSRIVRRATVPPGYPVSAEEVAYLNEGRRRVIQVAVARLIESGALRVQRSGVLQATGPGGRTELDSAILRQVTSRPQTTRDLEYALSAHPFLEGLRAQLQARRLIIIDTWKLRFVRALPLLVVFLIGVVRLLNGVQLHRPVAILAFLLVLSVAILIGMVVWRRSGETAASSVTDKRSLIYWAPILPLVLGPLYLMMFFGAWGAATLLPAAGLIGLVFWYRRLRHTWAATKLLTSLERFGQAPGVAPLTGTAGTVAMGGPAAFPDPVIAAALQVAPLDRRPSARGSSSSSDYSSSNSSSTNSCGGSSGCGG